MSQVAPLLQVRDLHVRFAGRGRALGRKKDQLVARAVDGVDLTLGEGEILALAGESGCGKTTLARSIMGFVRPDEGEILFEGEPLGKNLRAYRRKVQMVSPRWFLPVVRMVTIPWPGRDALSRFSSTSLSA